MPSRSRRSLIAVLLPLLLALAGTVTAAPPEGLSARDWHQLRDQLEATRYHARNPAHGWRIDYRRDGRTRQRQEGLTVNKS